MLPQGTNLGFKLGEAGRFTWSGRFDRVRTGLSKASCEVTCEPAGGDAKNDMGKDFHENLMAWKLGLAPLELGRALLGVCGDSLASIFAIEQALLQFTFEGKP